MKQTLKVVLATLAAILGGMVGALVWFMTVLSSYYRKKETDEHTTATKRNPCIKVRVVRRIRR